MSDLRPIAADPATKAAVAAYAAERGISQTKALAEIVELHLARASEDESRDGLMADPDGSVLAQVERASRMAAERSQSPAETLAAALDALARPTNLVTPQPRTEPVWADGQPACKCDGPEENGPHHRPGCHRRNP